MNKEDLILSVKKFKAARIAVVGDVLLDRYVYGIVERVNPENPAVPLLKIINKESRLGGAGNVALNLASLGAKTSLYTATGDDYNAMLIENMCKQSGIDFFSVKEGQTIVKERAIENEFNKYLMRADDGELHLRPLSTRLEQQLFEHIKNSEVDAIVLSDYNKVVFKGDLGSKIIAWAKAKKIPVIVDPKPANIDAFKNSTLICPNIKEAKEIVGLKIDDEKEITKKLKEYVQSDYIVITCGKKGMLIYDGDHFIEISTKAKELVDVTGAGDTVASSLALALVSGVDLESAAHIANYAAGVVIGKAGTSTVNKEEIIERIIHDGD